MNNSYNIYLIHGYTANSQANWFPDLKKHLESDKVKVHVFDMPDPYSPKESEWLDSLQKNIETTDGKSIFIGHSLGCVTILNFLADKDLNNIEGLFLISGFVEETPIAELSEFVQRKIDYSKFINGITNRIVISAEDDDIVPYLYSEILANKLDAQFRLLKSGKHFIDRDGFTEFPYLIKLIQEVL